jgi:hypothetical protein
MFELRPELASLKLHIFVVSCRIQMHSLRQVLYCELMYVASVTDVRSYLHSWHSDSQILKVPMEAVGDSAEVTAKVVEVAEEHFESLLDDMTAKQVFAESILLLIILKLGKILAALSQDHERVGNQQEVA